MKRYTFIFICAFSLSCVYSQSIYHKDALTILADSLYKVGDYHDALSLREQAIKTQKNASSEYRSYLNANYFHTNSALLEFESYNYRNPSKVITKKIYEQYLDSALQSSIRARDLYSGVKQADKMFQYNIQNRIYHQTAYLGDWKHALEQAQLGYNFLTDTLPKNDKIFVDLIFDMGYIYDKLGDYSKALENYQTSLDLYQNNIGEINHDVALAYHNISVPYRNLGLRKKELESLLKAEAIWGQLKDEKLQQFLYRCYGNLFYWYSYYGDFDKAEEYILKKSKLRSVAKTTNYNDFLRNKEEIYEDKLSEWYDLMLHYLRKKDTIKTVFYAENILKTIDSNRELFEFEAKKGSSTLKFYASVLETTNSERALQMLDNAIAVQEKYKEVFYTKSLNYKLQKVELLLTLKKHSEAEQLLEDLNDLTEVNEISKQFQLAILNGKTFQALYKNKKAEFYFNKAFSLLKDSDINLEQLEIDDLKPLISFETIEGFLAMGDFYMQLYKEKNSEACLKKATHRYLMASKI